MSIFGPNPFGPRGLARNYVRHQRPEDREEIRGRIRQQGGAAHEATWDQMEEIWLDGGVSDDAFENSSVGLMDNTEASTPAAPELPHDLVLVL